MSDDYDEPDKDELLSIHDFNQLRQNPHPESRAAVARKIGRHLDHSDHNTAEYQIACEIAFYLQKDDQKAVRLALAESVQDSESAPKQLVLLLATDDEDEIAIPILRCSPQIIDEDLITMIPQIQKAVRLVAVAERKFLSVTVSSMLIERNIEDVAVALLGNDSAILDEEVILQIAHKHARSKPVLGRMMKRMPLPAMAVNHMVKMQQSSGQENQTPVEIRSFSSLDKEALKEDVLSLLFLGRSPAMHTIEHLVDQMEEKKRISATFLLLAMCLGYDKFFLIYMSKNTYLPYERIEELAGMGEQEFSMLMNKSGVSPSLYSLMYHVYKNMRLAMGHGLSIGSEEFSDEMIGCMIDAETKGINFATTIGKPLAKALRATFG